MKFISRYKNRNYQILFFFLKMLFNSKSSFLKLCILLLLWYSISSIANIIGKRLLTIFPHPFTVTLVQLFHGWVYSIPLLRLIHIPPPIYLHSTRIYYLTIMVPLAIGKLLSQLTSQISLRLVPVSYTHTVKALMPLFTVILSRIILREKHSMIVSEYDRSILSDEISVCRFIYH
jgi:solute carrier family 35 protein E1